MRHALPHMSHNALAAFVKFSKENDISDLGTSAFFYRDAVERDLPISAFGDALTTATLVSVPPHANTNAVLVNPFTTLDIAFRQGGGFSKFFEAKLREHPPYSNKPWRLVLYADEIVPGNPLAVANARKAWAMYYSFLEFGTALACEDVWLPIAAYPTQALKTVSGGVSQLFAVVVKQFFGGLGFDMKETGMQLVGPDGNRWRFFASLAMVVQDGGAHKSIFLCKGDAGTRMCMLCKNVVAVRSKLTNVDGTKLLKSNVIFAEDLDLATDADVRGALRRLEAHKRSCSATTFKVWEQSIGFTYCEHGSLQDAALERYVFPTTIYCHDWMHGVMCGGADCIVLLRFPNSDL